MTCSMTGYGAGLFSAMAEDDNDPDSESNHRMDDEEWPLSTQILAAIAFVLFFILLVAVESPVI